MEQLEHLDWSFLLVVLLLVALVILLVLRHRWMRRRQKHAEKRARQKVYKAWLNSSGMELPPHHRHTRRRQR